MERANLQESEVFFSSGSTLLNLALAGGWPLRRMFNLVGDRSSGKTLIAIEGMANFDFQFPNGRIRYAEAEAALDERFAEVLGLPDKVSRPEKPLETVEEFYDDLETWLGVGKGEPCLYILDSLDALSDKAEMAAKITDGTYGTAKAKQLSATFRRLIQKIHDKNCALGIISQIRDNIGVMFGPSKTRSGGHALDFYATHVVWLSEVGKLKRTVMKEERPYGVTTRAQVKKNKVGLPFREVEFDILFNYGVDDETSMLNWLKEHDVLDKASEVSAWQKKQVEAAEKKFKDKPEELEARKKEIDAEVEAKMLMTQDVLGFSLNKAREQRDRAALTEVNTTLRTKTVEVWNQIEARLAPPMRKYER